MIHVRGVVQRLDATLGRVHQHPVLLVLVHAILDLVLVAVLWQGKMRAHRRRRFSWRSFKNYFRTFPLPSDYSARGAKADGRTQDGARVAGITHERVRR